MKIIPVIDLKAGRAVLARQGKRKNYQPISTPLCASSQLSDVIDAYLSLYAFAQIYIADLDALMGTGNNQKLIYSVIADYPQLNFIIDCGSLQTDYTAINVTPIIGTESVDKQALIAIKRQTNDFILSLDFCALNKPMGDPVLYKSPVLWPQQLIIMTLGLVGKNNGPDLMKLQHYFCTYPEHNFIAAGGIRHKQDLIQLKETGIQHTLVASALHNGALTATDIRQLSP